MDILDRATSFLNGGSPNDTLIDILRACVDDGGSRALAAVQQLAESMAYGTHDFEMKAPAAYTLCHWGDAGLDALMEMARRTPKSKNISLCAQILADLAAGSRIRVETFVRDPSLVALVQQAFVHNDALQLGARRRLRQFVLDVPEDRDAFEIVGRQLAYIFDDGGHVVATELFAALASRQLAVGGSTLARYRALLETAPDDEPAFQTFLEGTPQMLDPAALAVWARPTIVGAKQPDFVVRRSDDTYVVVEIEAPSKPLMTQGNQLSADATHAVAQATDYRSFLVDRMELARSHFPRFRMPECLVVIGLERALSGDQAAALVRANQSYHRLRVVGFDWIADRAEAVLRNMIETLPVRARVRVF